jgi:predicted ArsR family transcriptional regulator
LQSEGWVEPTGPARSEHRTGRPASLFQLTTAGDHLFPKSYADLATSVLGVIATELGGDASQRVLAGLVDARVAEKEESLRDLPLAEKVQALKGLYSNDDPYMEVETIHDGFRLVERNCPYYNVAMEHPALCSVSVDTLSRLLGVHVEREETFQHGDRRCAFRIFAGQPAAKP